MIKICCIYKIISPNDRIYIGQTIDFNRRLKNYFHKKGKGQSRLYNSIIRHGLDSHTIEIIEQCSVEELNEKERYWQDFFEVLGKKGLNCILTKTDEKRAKYSQEVKDKISKANLKAHAIKRSNRIALCKKIRKSLIIPEVTRKYYAKFLKKKRIFKEKNDLVTPNKIKIFKKRKRKPRFIGCYMLNLPGTSLILNSETGIYYESISSASKSSHKLNAQTLRAYLSGRRKNKSNFIKV